ncbi:MAG: arginine--tRNA ligase [Patescibacteria group bacterium]|nr:arginine--tRNA ligase [Patescibacteria group bacterium]
MTEKIAKILKSVIKEDVEVAVSASESAGWRIGFGHYSSNVAFKLAKIAGKSPLEVAKDLAGKLSLNKEFEKVEAAAPGFVNFWLKPEYFQEELAVILKQKDKYGKNEYLKGQKIMVDYTDPNPFKEFHIGHLMSNAIGESLCRIFEWNGAKVVRVCYQGDVGLHVAKTIWGILQDINNFPKDSANLSEKIAFLGKSYVLGSQKYEDDKVAAEEIKEINKKVFERSDKQINILYEKGKKWSLKHFDEVYKKLGTKFDHFILESSVISDAEKIVREFLKKGVFEESNGAVVFPGEKYGLHTRVFINSQGLPTYETKDIGLAKKKMSLEKGLTSSLIVTANEQNDYFRVVFKALEFIFPEYAKISKHIGHGMLRFASGKMSSRAGNVITAESLIGEVEKLVEAKIAEQKLTEKEKKEIKDVVSIGAIKYSILRQAIGGDIIFDLEKSISFEGDSGPYLQYAYTRAKSVLEKASNPPAGGKVKPSLKHAPKEISELEVMLSRFSEIVERSGKEQAPHYIATYLIELARVFNAYYAKFKIVDAKDEYSPYKVALTSAFMQVMKNGLEILGIKVPEKM